jgi:NAD-dependent dihydropyrimidine dehydrogenase PreA subunit
MPWFAGVPRDQVQWFPALDADKCVGCGMCMNCGKKVYDWLPDQQKAVVARPMECVVGCNTCANLCRGRAISFPDVKELLKFYARHQVWDHAKLALISEGRIAAVQEKKLT